MSNQDDISRYSHLPPAQLPTDDPDPDIQSLAAYDEELRRGGLPQFSSDSLATTTGGAPSDELTNCLHFLERAWPRSTTPKFESIHPVRIARFQIERVLGCGGFAIVYLATDPLLQRQVALKVPRLHALASESLRSRFSREARATATLDHPNVVPIYETGEHGQICYITSAYCPGPTLAEWFRQQEKVCSPRIAASLLACLSDAVHYSHTQGVLHRDLKPSNVLLAPRPTDKTNHLDDDLPFVPKLTDFGLAKLVENNLDETATNAVLGTPLYMAPEQSGLTSQEVDCRTDVYGLGVILYELLIGRTPFQGSNASSVLEQVRQCEPVRPRRLRPEMPRDLEVICLKCLSKDSGLRYQTARELAEDLRRFLKGEPILARPLGIGTASMKWIRRRPAVASLIGLVGLVIVLFGLLFEYQERFQQNRQTVQKLAVRQQQQEDLGRQTRQSHYALQIRLVESVAAKNPAEAIQLLNAVRPLTGQDDLRGFEWYYWWEYLNREVRVWPGGGGSAYALEISPDGKTVAIGRASEKLGKVELRDAKTGSIHMELEMRRVPSVYGISFSPDGERCAAGGGGHTDGRGEVRIWNTTTGQVVTDLPGKFGSVNSVLFSNDGQKLHAAGCGLGKNVPGMTREWNLETSQIRRDMSAKMVVAIAADPAGKWLIDAGSQLRLWNLDNGKVITTLDVPPKTVWGLALTRDGTTLVTGGYDGSIKCFEVATRRTLQVFAGHTQPVYAVAISPDGKFIASGSEDKTLKLWRLNPARLMATLPVEATVRSLKFTPDGTAILCAATDGTIRSWSFPRTHDLDGHPEESWGVAFSPNGKTAVSVGDNARQTQNIMLWDTETRKKKRSLAGHPSLASTVAFAPDGQSFATGSYDQSVKIWDAATCEGVATLTGHAGAIRSVAYSPDGRLLASGGRDPNVRIWDVSSRRIERILQVQPATEPQEPPTHVRAVIFSPDGKTLAAGCMNGTIRLWSLADLARNELAPRRTIRDDHPIWCVAFSPDGNNLASGNEAGRIRLWSLESGDPLAALEGHVGGVRGIAFTPNGKTLASAGVDRSLRLWQASTGEVLTTLQEHLHEINSLAISRDGKNLIAASHDGAIKLWVAPNSPD